MLPGAAAAVGFAVINSAGNPGGFVYPYVMGFLQDAPGGSNVTGLFFMSGMAIVGRVQHSGELGRARVYQRKGNRQ